MTVPDSSALPARAVQALRTRWVTLLESGVALIALVVWARPVAADDAGRLGSSLVWGVGVVLAAALVQRPWRMVGRRALYLSAALAVGAAGVAVFSLYQWTHVQSVLTATGAAAAFLLVASYVNSARRAASVAVALSLACLDEFSQGFLAWWGHGDATHPMIGTFSWYNQFGSYLLAGAVVSFAAFLACAGTARMVALLVGTLLATGVVLSTSRGSLVALFLGWVTVAVAYLVWTRLWKRLAVSLVVGAAAIYAALLLFTSKLMFPHGAGSPLGAVLSRSAKTDGTGSFSGNGAARLQYMRSAFDTFLAHPWSGLGYDTLTLSEPRYLPEGFTVLSPYAHDGVAQAFGEGGLLLGLPVLAAAIAAVVLVANALRSHRRRTPSDGEASAFLDSATHGWVRVGSAGAIVAMLLHSLMDYDWEYPLVAVMLAAMCGLAYGNARVLRDAALRDAPDLAALHHRPVPARRWRETTAVVAVLAVGLVGLMAAQSKSTNDTVLRQAGALAGKHHYAEAIRYLAAHTPSTFADVRYSQSIAAFAASAGKPAGLPLEIVTKAINDPRYVAAASIDGRIGTTRGEALWAVGEHERGYALIRSEALRWQAKHPSLLADYASYMALEGHPAQAKALLASKIAYLTLPRAKWGNQPFDPHQTLLLVLMMNRLTGNSALFQCVAQQYTEAYAGNDQAMQIVLDARPSKPAPRGTPCR